MNTKVPSQNVIVFIGMLLICLSGTTLVRAVGDCGDMYETLESERYELLIALYQQQPIYREVIDENDSLLRSVLLDGPYNEEDIDSTNLSQLLADVCSYCVRRERQGERVGRFVDVMFMISMINRANGEAMQSCMRKYIMKWLSGITRDEYARLAPYDDINMHSSFVNSVVSMLEDVSAREQAYAKSYIERLMTMEEALSFLMWDRTVMNSGEMIDYERGIPYEEYWQRMVSVYNELASPREKGIMRERVNLLYSSESEELRSAVARIVGMRDADLSGGAEIILDYIDAGYVAEGNALENNEVEILGVEDDRIAVMAAGIDTCLHPSVFQYLLASYDDNVWDDWEVAILRRVQRYQYIRSIHEHLGTVW